jgi:hypothetical protein
LSAPTKAAEGERSLHYRVLIVVIIISLALASPASAYGKSVEDLVGSFSIGKTIKIGSSSECFSSGDALDPLTPPQSGAVGPLSDDQAPSLAGFSIEPQQLSHASIEPINLTAHLIDDQAVWMARAAFSGPSGQEAIALLTSEDRTAGTAKDGSYSTQMMLPEGNETCLWQLQNITLVDQQGNRRVLSEEDLRDLGLPTMINVV